MKVSKILLTALTLMTISSSAFAGQYTYSTPQNVDYCKHKMNVWTKMCEQNDTVTPVIEASRFYIEGDMHIAYYDEWVNVEKDFAGRRITTVGTPSKLLDILNRGNN